MSDIFKVDTIENVGENWLIADFGVDTDGKHYILTTDCVHASELHRFSDNPKADAELVAELLNQHFADAMGRKRQPEMFCLLCAMPLNGEMRIHAACAAATEAIRPSSPSRPLKNAS